MSQNQAVLNHSALVGTKFCIPSSQPSQGKFQEQTVRVIFLAEINSKYLMYEHFPKSLSLEFIKSNYPDS